MKNTSAKISALALSLLLFTSPHAYAVVTSDQCKTQLTKDSSDLELAEFLLESAEARLQSSDLFVQLASEHVRELQSELNKQQLDYNTHTQNPPPHDALYYNKLNLSIIDLRRQVAAAQRDVQQAMNDKNQTYTDVANAKIRVMQLQAKLAADQGNNCGMGKPPAITPIPVGTNNPPTTSTPPATPPATKPPVTTPSVPAKPPVTTPPIPTKPPVTPPTTTPTKPPITPTPTVIIKPR